MRLTIFASITIATLISSMALAEPPALMPIQGFLTDADGEVIDGDVDLTFAIYDQASGGSVLWSEERTDYTVEDGFFTVYLGDETAIDLSVFEATELWLEMTVDTEALSRVQLASVPFALEAAVARRVGWLDVAGVPGDLSDGDDTLTSAEVGAFANAEGFAQLSLLNDGNATTAPVGWPDLTGVPTFVHEDDLNDADPGTVVVDWRDLTIPNVITLSPGDDIQGAIDSITDAHAANPYLLWLGPGIYPVLLDQPFELDSCIHLRGSGRDQTTIRARDSAAVVLDHLTSISDLRVERDGSTQGGTVVSYNGSGNAAIRRVDVVQLDAGENCRGIELVNHHAMTLELEQVNITLVGREGWDYSRYGLEGINGPGVRMVGGRISVDTGRSVAGIWIDLGSTVDLIGAEVVAENGTTYTNGILAYESSGNSGTLTIRGGSVSASGPDANALDFRSGTQDVSGATISASGAGSKGVFVYTDAVTTIRQSTIEGGTEGSGDLTLSHVHVFGGGVSNTGSIACHLVSVDDGDSQYVAFAQPNSCVAE